MDRQLKIIEVSLSFNVYGIPKTPVNDVIPFVVDIRGIETERVVPVDANIESIPDWVHSYKQKNSLRFMYVSDLQNVECIFKESCLTLYGIKYRNFDALCNPTHGHLNTIFGILNIAPINEPITMYKATMVLDAGAPWNRDAIADVITNDPKISQTAAISEKLSTLGGRSIFSVSIMTEDIEYVRVTLRHDYLNKRKVVVTMSRLPSVDASVQVAGIVTRIFRTYADNYADTPIKYTLTQKFSRLSGITHLRKELPEFFVNNYTRECPVLPIMISQEQAELLENVQRVIFYPVNSSMGRFYTAPKGYFVGLKKNRLVNYDVFPCLVTCYLHDHMLRKGSETYKYYMGEGVVNKSKVARPIPKSMGCNVLATRGHGYDRIRVSSFKNAIEFATGVNLSIVDLPWCPQIVKQEMWDTSDNDIMDMIISTGCKASTYRYFEELFATSIHVVVIRNGMFEPLVEYKLRRNEYIWTPPYPRHVVVFETIKKVYSETRILYDVLAINNVTLFNDSDPVIMSIVSQKSAESVPPVDTDDAVEQLIDENGKCRLIVNSKGDHIETLTRPLAVPVIPSPACFFDLHVSKMNSLKACMGLPEIDLYKRSTNKVLYFPNNESFLYWLKIAERKQL